MEWNNEKKFQKKRKKHTEKGSPRRTGKDKTSFSSTREMSSNIKKKKKEKKERKKEKIENNWLQREGNVAQLTRQTIAVASMYVAKAMKRKKHRKGKTTAKKKKEKRKKKEDEKKEKRRENGEMWLRSALPLAGTKRFEHGTPPSKDVNIPRC